MPAAPLPVRPRHLQHRNALPGQEPGQPRPVTASPLHPHPGQHAEPAQPGQQLAIPPGSRRERPGPQHPPHMIDHRRHMHIPMRIHTPGHPPRRVSGDNPAAICDPGQQPLLSASQEQGRRRHAGTSGQTTYKTHKGQAPIKPPSPRRAGGHAPPQPPAGSSR